MHLHLIDWVIILIYMIFSLIIGLIVSKKAGKNSTEFFAAGKNMPWWLLGVSMVATTFSTDTPNLVTNIVRKNGVAGNWTWWAFLLTGMLTAFIYAKLWKRSGVLTDVEFYELRYSGKMAAFLRGFRAVYLGLIFNVIIMATVSLAAIKIGSILMGLTPLQTILLAGSITVIYSSLGGLQGVLITDFFQFFLAMAGAVIAAYVALSLPSVGGLTGLLSHKIIQQKINILPDFSNTDAFITIFLLPIMVQWWSVYYPGAEPGGGGYIAQRMFAAKDEDNSMASVFFFNAAQYALRPWPWILVALASLVVFPNLHALQAAFPNSKAILGNDMGYPAMLTFLPPGLMGVVVASLIAAYMSTISTQLNWGSSYIVNDFYQRFIRPEGSQKELVLVGRISTVLLMILAGWVAILMRTALGSFNIILEIGAGTGLLFILRWFWWRINAYSEIAAMVISFIIAIFFQLVYPYTGLPILPTWLKLVIGVVLTTIGWITVTFMTRPTDHEKLVDFIKLIRPGGPGWRKVVLKEESLNGPIEEIADSAWQVPQGIIAMVIGCVAIYSAMIAIGYWLYMRYMMASILTIICFVSSYIMIKYWKRLKQDTFDEELFDTETA